MKIGDSFPSKYLKASDLGDKTVTVTIDRVVMEEVGQGEDKENKPCVYFKGKEKGVVLNKTNSEAITRVTGSDDTDDWVGKPISIFAATVDFKGKPTLAIRVSLVKPKPAAAPAAKKAASPPVLEPAAEQGDLQEDEVPF